VPRQRRSASACSSSLPPLLLLLRCCCAAAAAAASWLGNCEAGLAVDALLGSTAMYGSCGSSCKGGGASARAWAGRYLQRAAVMARYCTLIVLSIAQLEASSSAQRRTQAAFIAARSIAGAFQVFSWSRHDRAACGW
jgi:hypothetical protein